MLGFFHHIEGAHESEAVILYYTDDSILGIDTESNVANIADEQERSQPDDFHHGDFLPLWVPPPL